MSQPLVSVIVPTKNSSRTLADCLASIKDQSYKPLELIVVDNFSSDNTPEIAKKYTKQFYTQGPERSPQRNFGVNQASGKYVIIIDSDMNLSKDVINECVDLVESNNSISGVIIPEESFGEGFWAQCKKLERSFYVGVSYMEAARFFKRKDYLKLKGYNESLVSGEDWDLSQRIGSLGKIGSIKSYIYHDEGKISLSSTIRKKFYYAKKFSQYKDLSSNQSSVSKQTSIIGRYRLFLLHPRKLFANPIIGLGMLFMKTCEFGFGGAGYIVARIQNK
ncbi:MAG: hypothetical protein JWN12_428 [Candidatus Saccharibacteria bacterium]|nr:hypothetical protein [Candidatus Saccharibacteria bacterium]